MTEIHLQPADANQQSYGIRFVSQPFTVTGKGVRNPGHPHTVKMWENRRSATVPIRFTDPSGNLTTDRWSFTLSASPVVIDGMPHPRAGTITIDSVVRLVADGDPLGEFIVTPQRMADPILIPAN
jgi:hypothetical protein